MRVLQPTISTKQLTAYTTPSALPLHRVQRTTRRYNNPTRGINTTQRVQASAELTAETPSTSTNTVPSTSAEEVEVRPGVFEGFWSWKGYTIRYLRSGTSGPPLLCVHGFGGNGKRLASFLIIHMLFNCTDNAYGGNKAKDYPNF